MNLKYWILPLLLLLPCGARAIPKLPAQEMLNVQELLRELGNPDPAVRESAVLKTRQFAAQLELGRYEASQHRARVSDAVKKLLNDKEKRVRYLSALALRRLAYDNEVDRNLPIPVFIEAIKDPQMTQPQVLTEVIKEFWFLEHERGAGEVKARKEEIITALKGHIKDRDKHIRYSAAIALGEFDSNGTKNLILPVLLEILADIDETILMFDKIHAASVCGIMGPEAKEAVPGIIQAKKEMESKGWNTSSYTNALIKIGTPEALDAAYGGRTLYIAARALSYHPVSDFLAAFFFGWLFWKSVKLRRQGKKVFHWLLIIPAAFYTLYGVGNTFVSPDNNPDDVLGNRTAFMVLASIGFVPWLLSWLFIWLRKWKQSRPAP
ncbi:MAG: hypothetical protein ABIG11_04880 [bacterium]